MDKINVYKIYLLFSRIRTRNLLPNESPPWTTRPQCYKQIIPGKKLHYASFKRSD